jgi:hypothetical protein
MVARQVRISKMLKIDDGALLGADTERERLLGQ